MKSSRSGTTGWSRAAHELGKLLNFRSLPTYFLPRWSAPPRPPHRSKASELPRARRVDLGSRSALQIVLQVPEPIAPAADIQHVAGVQQPIQDRRRDHLVARQHL